MATVGWEYFMIPEEKGLNLGDNCWSIAWERKPAHRKPSESWFMMSWPVKRGVSKLACLSGYWLNSMAEDTWKLSRRQAIARVPNKVNFDVVFGQTFVRRVVYRSILLQVPPAKSAMEEPQATAEGIAGVLMTCRRHCKKDTIGPLRYWTFSLHTKRVNLVWLGRIWTLWLDRSLSNHCCCLALGR